LVYGTIVEGLGQAAGTLASTAKVARMIIDGVPMAMATQSFSAIDLNLKPTFNPAQGYVSYVVPAIFIFILHQMLIVGIGIHTASEEKPLTLTAACVRTLLFVSLFLLLASYYFGWSLDYYNVAIHGDISDILLIMVPMLIGASVIGILLGELVPHREMVTAVVLMGSMPLIFGAGFVWPIAVMPDAINLLMSFSPSTPAIQALLKLNQMGASFNQVQGHYLLLLAQMVLWSLMLVYLVVLRNRKLALNFR
jgi:ABC-2 type transport system permease protein